MEYVDETRGEIQRPNKAKQMIAFNGLTFGKASPTDIDAMIEWHGKAYVFFEVKFADAELPRGQALALTRIADALRNAGKEAIVIVCEHHVRDARKPVMLKDTSVRRYYYNGKWYPSHGCFTGKDVHTTVQRFLEAAEGGCA